LEADVVVRSPGEQIRCKLGVGSGRRYAHLLVVGRIWGLKKVTRRAWESGAWPHQLWAVASRGTGWLSAASRGLPWTHKPWRATGLESCQAPEGGPEAATDRRGGHSHAAAI